MVALESMIVRQSDILSAQVDDETVLMHVESGAYYVLTATSRTIWERLVEPIRVRDLCAALASLYEAPLQTVEADTLAFLHYLDAQKMIVERHDKGPESATPPSIQDRPA